MHIGKTSFHLEYISKRSFIVIAMSATLSKKIIGTYFNDQEEVDKCPKRKP